MDEPLLPALPGYEHPQLIAHGTTALVFRAKQTRLNRLVAIKVITVDTGSVPVDAARELATTVALSSQPHIVSIIDTGITPDDRPYIVMEYCEGGSYAQILRHQGQLPVEDVIEVGIKIGEALHAAHQAGIVHRDVKPSNILRSRFGPALTDFGIARAPDELSGTLTREMMTPHHASPEALLHQAQSGPSDVYSLASTMWTLLIGHPPFVDPARPPADMYAFRDRVLHDPLPAMTREEVAGWLVAELAKAMSKLPAQRHASALEFAECIRRGSLGLATTTPAVDAGQPTTRPTTVAHVSSLPPQAWPFPEPLGAEPPKADSNPADLPKTGPLNTNPPETHPPETHLPRTDVPRYAATTPAVARTGASATSPSPATSHEFPALALTAPPGSGPGLYRPHTIDEGGWLGPPLPGEPASDEADTSRQRPSTRHFGEADLRPTSTRRNGLVILLVTVAVLGIAVGAALVLTANSPHAPTAEPTTGLATSDPANDGGGPRDVVVTRNATSVTVRWTDPTTGSVPFLIVGSGPNGQKLPAQNVPAGETSATFTKLDPAKRYCFVVGAIYSVDRVATAPETCTNS